MVKKPNSQNSMFSVHFHSIIQTFNTNTVQSACKIPSQSYTLLSPAVVLVAELHVVT